MKKVKITYHFPDGSSSSVDYSDVIQARYREAEILQRNGDPSAMNKLMAELASAHGGGLIEKQQKSTQAKENQKQSAEKRRQQNDLQKLAYLEVVEDYVQENRIIEMSYADFDDLVKRISPRLQIREARAHFREKINLTKKK
jgi:TPP-dependent 2-oxoacid decarboxylase